MRVSGVRAIKEGTRVEGSADAFWLARKEMRRAWPSYVLGGSIVSCSFAFALMVVVAVLEWTAEVGLLERTTRLARSGYGALASIFSNLAGGVTFVLLKRAAVRHVQKTKPVRGSLRVSVDA